MSMAFRHCLAEHLLRDITSTYSITVALPPHQAADCDSMASIDGDTNPRLIRPENRVGETLERHNVSFELLSESPCYAHYRISALPTGPWRAPRIRFTSGSDDWYQGVPHPWDGALIALRHCRAPLSLSGMVSQCSHPTTIKISLTLAVPMQRHRTRPISVLEWKQMLDLFTCGNHMCHARVLLPCSAFDGDRG
jgi:hypothetical protein